MNSPSATQWFSLRSRLFALLLGCVVIPLVAVFLFNSRNVHHEIDELFDAQLAQAGQTLLSLAEHNPQAMVKDVHTTDHEYQSRLRFQILNRHGERLLHSENLPHALAISDGFSVSNDQHGHWRHFSRWNTDHTLQVQISENHTVRDEMVQLIMWRMFWSSLWVLPLLIVGVWLTIRHGLIPLHEVARQINQRSPNQLDEVLPKRAPSEIRPLIAAINGFIRRVSEALDNERHFTSNAAHELRTPLSALKAQLQVAERARDPAEQQHSLQQLNNGLTRSMHLLEELLLLARLDPHAQLPAPQTIKINCWCENVCADLGSRLLTENIDFQFLAASDDNLACWGQEEWLRVLLNNLLLNAINHCSPQGKIQLTIHNTANEFCVQLCDDGPGIAAADRERVFHRFFRAEADTNPHSDNGKKIPGCGLGLAIAKRIADLHHFSLTMLDRPDGASGLCVQIKGSLYFPTASHDHTEHSA